MVRGRLASQCVAMVGGRIVPQCVAMVGGGIASQRVAMGVGGQGSVAFGVVQQWAVVQRNQSIVIGEAMARCTSMTTDTMTRGSRHTTHTRQARAHTSTRRCTFPHSCCCCCCC
eukprot:TRINITY_DN12299_c0_g1_i2.p1 TRINITY_DN12299_c0_g1~~TRINITY_DN12299_c0_g1_i2.p1  ORF type:complete len:114 (+),score=7.48 TRINITY_DN12299_c0_g1_i2:319-660(+)